MYPLSYSISKQDGLDVIHIKGNPIILTVYPLLSRKYRENALEFRYYIEHRQETLVFETTGWSPLADPFHLHSLQLAVKWYSQKMLHHSSFFISTTVPLNYAEFEVLN